jgi:hypothetical protein
MSLYRLFSAATIMSSRHHGPAIVEPCVATAGLLHRSLPRVVLDDRCSPTATVKGSPLLILPAPSLTSFRARPHHRSLFFLRLVFGQPTTIPSFPFAVPHRASSPSIFTNDVEGMLRSRQEKNSSRAAIHDSVLEEVQVTSLDAGGDVSLHHRRNLSALSFSCTHSLPASS